MRKALITWLLICTLSAIATIVAVRTLDERYGLRQKLGLDMKQAAQSSP